MATCSVRDKQVSLLVLLQILELAVAAASRRQGAGKALLSHLLAHHSFQACTATLEVRSTNSAAIALYSALGFAQVT